jgi:multicomponent Na+:H+ antiporter subunit E
MSGIYDKPLTIGFGLISAVIAVLVTRRMDAVDNQHIEFHINIFKFFGYLGWLMVEIAKSNWAVTKLAMSPQIKLRQHIFEVPYTQKSPLAQTVFANSITLTPGTITVEVEPEHFIVHALNYSDDDDMDALAEMDRRVAAFESRGAK